MVIEAALNVRRLGILGGSFDPVHLGHLIVAEILAYELTLEHVLFLPASQPPHKPTQVLAPNVDRLRMIELAIDAIPEFSVSTLDLDRPGPSFTVDTLEVLKSRVSAATELYFLMGMDSLRDFPRWRNPARIAELARLGVARRPGVDVSPREVELLVPIAHDRIDIIDVPLIDISSSDIRDRVRSGRPYRFQVTPVVARYISETGLYRDLNSSENRLF
jgi:nicotinate-nucleotide adenylyltransferase